MGGGGLDLQHPNRPTPQNFKWNSPKFIDIHGTWFGVNVHKADFAEAITRVQLKYTTALIKARKF